jgi:hypothetical protein
VSYYITGGPLPLVLGGERRESPTVTTKYDDGSMSVVGPRHASWSEGFDEPVIRWSKIVWADTLSTGPFTWEQER